MLSSKLLARVESRIVQDTLFNCRPINRTINRSCNRPLYFTPRKPLYSNTNSTSMETFSHFAIAALRPFVHTYLPLCTAGYSFMHLNELKQREVDDIALASRLQEMDSNPVVSTFSSTFNIYFLVSAKYGITINMLRKCHCRVSQKAITSERVGKVSQCTEHVSCTVDNVNSTVDEICFFRSASEVHQDRLHGEIAIRPTTWAVCSSH